MNERMMDVIKAYEAPKVTDLKGQKDQARKVENYSKSSGPVVYQKPVFNCNWRR